MQPPLTVRADPALLRTPRHVLASLGWGLAYAIFGATLMGLVAVAAFGLGLPVPAALAITLMALTATAMFALGAYKRWLHRERDPGVTVGADGITLRREGHTAFYRWSEIHSVKIQNAALLMGLDEGYAYRVQFRTEGRLEWVVRRIQQEREAHAARAQQPRAEPPDVPQPGAEERWIARQRARVEGKYRSRHDDTSGLINELLDVDAPLYQRFSAAIALSTGGDPQGLAAIEDARKHTASEDFGGALAALLAGRDDATLARGLVALQSRSHARRVPPVGAPLALARFDPTPAPVRIDTTVPVERETEAQATEEALAEQEAESQRTATERR